MRRNGQLHALSIHFINWFQTKSIDKFEKQGMTITKKADSPRYLLHNRWC